MHEVTRILNAVDQGDPHVAEQLLPLVYDELRKLAAVKLAQEKPGQTLQATALVHEAYVRLVGESDVTAWRNRGHFFGAAAEAMRRDVRVTHVNKRPFRNGVRPVPQDVPVIVTNALHLPKEDLHDPLLPKCVTIER